MKTSMSAVMAFILMFIFVAPALGQTDPVGDLPRSKLTMQSVMRVDLSKNVATVPLHKGTYNGSPVWYVRMDVSDANLARDLGLNFAPRLANASNGCPACVQTVKSSDPILGRADVEFAGTVDFSPKRILTPGPTGFPPLNAQPGSVAGFGYSDLVRVEGSSTIFNAPIVATGDGPFDVTTHSNTLDRVIAIDTQKMTVDLQFIRAFAFGKDIFYFTFGSSGALSAVLERGTFVPVLGTLPFANASDHPEGARSAIVTITNGKRGQMSPPAQGLMHVILDNPPGDLSLENIPLLESVARGGDAHNVLDSFPTLRDPDKARLYTPMWDLHIAQWSADAVASGQNDAQTDTNQIRQLAARKILTSPGNLPLGSANFVVNCPVMGFAADPPLEPLAADPTGGRPDLRPAPMPVAVPGLPAPATRAPAPMSAPAAQPPVPPALPNTSVEGAPVMFPQTGYSLNGDFLRFWRANGNLPVFGYPISSEQPDNGQIAQWLERGRFELHPDNAAPYKVLLGHLGVEALQKQGRAWQSFPKASRNQPHYFSETGHAIAHMPFWRYWSSHGLEVDGRRGVSTADSLALFGYPISEARMETNAGGAKVLTQWFERARFEYHPDNRALYQVLLGRLGAELRDELGR